MALEEVISNDLKEAMRSKNEPALRALRAIKSAIIIAKTDTGAGGKLEEADELKLLQKLAKQRKESIDIYRAQAREDLAKDEEAELVVIEKFLPQLMSESEIRVAVAEFISKTGASSPAEMGKVMGMASKELAGKADNKLVSNIVKELLSK